MAFIFKNRKNENTIKFRFVKKSEVSCSRGKKHGKENVFVVGRSKVFYGLQVLFLMFALLAGVIMALILRIFSILPEHSVFFIRGYRVVMAGFEQNQPNITPKVEPMIVLKGKNISWITVVEVGVGKSNYWWTSHLLYKATPKFSFGLMSRRFYGSGLQMKYQINKNLAGWVAVLYDHEAQTFKPTMSLKVSF